MNAPPRPVRAACLAGLEGVTHGFFTRRGGVSRGIYASLNCGPGSGDDPDAVAANRAAAAAALGLAGGRLATAFQVHGNRALFVAAPFAGPPPRADGLVTTTPGLAVGALSADCAPVLLADAEAGVVAAAHAGWRGALAGIVESTIAAMVAAGARASRIRAAIGPCIARESYEVGGDMRDAVLDRDPAGARHFVRGEGGDSRGARWRFDLSGYVAGRLRRAGAAAVEEAGIDGFADEARFFSYRRARRRGETDYGRCLSAIAPRPV